jgi:ribosomal protein S20
MKIVKISSSTESFYSSDIKTAYRNLREKIEKYIKEKVEEKLTIEIFDIENSETSLSTNLPNQKI